MRRPSMRWAGVFGLLLGATLSWATPLAVAQEATPVAVAPPQDLLPANADYGKGQTATINGVAIYYEVYGEGQGDPVVLLHSGLGNGDYFVNQIPPLAETARSRRHGQPGAWSLLVR